ncbi:MAG: MotA/TolQ/ExbB proton channel family protein [Myxococcaceae bacterium]|nr:MotA/TolQ/ExbB proton channel family protein [Myxococcaceae bacterium]
MNDLIPLIGGTAQPAARGGLEPLLFDLFLTLGSAWVLYLLAALSVLSLALAGERGLHFVLSGDDLARLQARLRQTLRAADVGAARELLEKSRSHAARIALSGLDALGQGSASVEEEMNAAAAVERLRMERGLAFLGTLGSNAPFVGLFGTVLGIIRAFRDLSANSAEGPSAVMSGIAEALIATAVGLLVALPAVAVFNLFQRTIKNRLGGSSALSHVLLAHAKAQKE